MRILVCSVGFNTRKNYAIDVFQFDQARALRDLGHDVRVVTLDLRSFRRVRRLHAACFEKEGIRAFTVNAFCGRVPGAIINPIGKACARKAFKMACRDGWRPDVMHAHFTDMAYFFCDVAKKNGVPYVVTEHSSMIHGETPRDVASQACYAYARADALIAVGASLASAMQKKFGVMPLVIPNIVDLGVFAAQPLPEKKGEGVVFVSAAHLGSGKGMDVLLQAFAALERPDATLCIMGDGTEAEALKKQAGELGVCDRVRFTGRYTREEFAKALSGADCFVLASRGETFGVVYVEAMAAGVPVIATRCGGPEGFVTPENGVLVNVDDMQALTVAMRDICDGKTSYKAREIRDFAIANFSPTHIAKCLEEVYEKIITKGSMSE